jgi:two-component system chemotaxis response regulator CheB
VVSSADHLRVGQPDRSWAESDEPSFGVVAIGGSAGGLAGICSIVADLPADFPIPVVLAHHRSLTGPELLEPILRWRARLRVKRVEESQPLEPGTLFLPPRGCHAVIGAGNTISVARTGPIRFVCPSVDLLFESVAEQFGPRGIGVVLSGMGSDGARGATLIRRNGGYVIAEDRSTAAFFDMPAASIETRKVDLVLGSGSIGFALRALVRSGGGERRPAA